MTPLHSAFLAFCLGGFANFPVPLTKLDASLLQAVRKGDTVGVKALLRQGANARARDKDGTTALMWAAVYGDVDLMNALPDGRADVNARNHAGATALMWSIGNIAKVKLLLDHGADVNVRANTGFTPLIIAANSEGSFEVLKLLLERGAAVNESSNGGFTALMAAAGGDSGEAVALLLRKGANARARNRAGWTALHSAATSGKADRVRALLERGADVNATETSQGRTPLMWAAAVGATDAVKLLLEKGANPNVRGTFGGDTALMRAAARGEGDSGSVKALLACGADPLARDRENLLPLDWALRQGNEAVAAAIRPGDQHAGSSKATLPSPKMVGEANTIAEALARSLPLLERVGPAFTAASDEHCITCHHQSLPALAIGLARKHGLQTNAKLEREQAAETLEALAPRRELYLQGIGVVDRLDPGYWLAGLAAAGHPANATTDALVHYLTLKQSDDGRWRASLYRPPMVGSDFTTTALTVRALQQFTPPGRAREIARRVDRARDWLRTATPVTTEDRVFQLLGLSWSGASAEDVRKATATLRALQREDGGWSQLPTLGSDAYATGQTLYALQQSGGLSATDPACQKAVKYLLRNQCADGSWFVPTRSMPVQPYFESGFPHGRSQFISCAATCWATMALTLTTPK
jgi:ankyrin repeat protein